MPQSPAITTDIRVTRASLESLEARLIDNRDLAGQICLCLTYGAYHPYPFSRIVARIRDDGLEYAEFRRRHLRSLQQSSFDAVVTYFQEVRFSNFKMYRKTGIIRSSLMPQSFC